MADNTRMPFTQEEHAACAAFVLSLRRLERLGATGGVGAAQGIPLLDPALLDETFDVLRKTPKWLSAGALVLPFAIDLESLLCVPTGTKDGYNIRFDEIKRTMLAGPKTNLRVVFNLDILSESHRAITFSVYECGIIAPHMQDIKLDTAAYRLLVTKVVDIFFIPACRKPITTPTMLRQRAHYAETAADNDFMWKMWRYCRE